MTTAVGRQPRAAGVPIGVAFVLHAAAIAAVFVAPRHVAPPTPPIYRVDIVAAPPGPRAVGTVQPTPPPATPVTPPPNRAAVAPAAPTVPLKAAPPTTRPAPTKATPVPPTAQPAKPATAPAAGGGPTGGRGADVATVRTQGIEFPYPGYLNNIVRQIALRFSPRNPNAPLRAEVRFVIRRDGSVSDFSFVTRSGNYAFDLDAQGAVEAAASARAFGPLPDAFPDDALPVVFSFDPSLLR